MEKFHTFTLVSPSLEPTGDLPIEETGCNISYHLIIGHKGQDWFKLILLAHFLANLRICIRLEIQKWAGHTGGTLQKQDGLSRVCSKSGSGCPSTVWKVVPTQPGLTFLCSQAKYLIKKSRAMPETCIWEHSCIRNTRTHTKKKKIKVLELSQCHSSASSSRSYKLKSSFSKLLLCSTMLCYGHEKV